MTLPDLGPNRTEDKGRQGQRSGGVSYLPMSPLSPYFLASFSRTSLWEKGDLLGMEGQRGAG